MDKQLVSAKLESLRRALARVRQRTPSSAAALAADIDVQDIVSLNLQRAVQLGVDIAYHLAADTETAEPATMADAFTALRDAGVIDPVIAEALRRAVGFRNIAVHQYEKMDWQIVFDVATKRIEDLEAFARAVAARL
ncbi:MAG: DUF86 domain-containing protein [Betaproteobacteria bacterium]|nr:DUF86 domain-containing protein [Betaproteobacteria bacterium]